MNRINAKLFLGSMLVIVASNSYGQETLDEVTVTATRRAESIQDVPVSVTTVGAEVMDKVGITNMEELSLLVPNFEINSSTVIPNLYIRGLGGGLTHSTEQSVGRFIDDVYIPRAVINLHPFLDVASVEVLRGPQGTLFGKNTAAGALIVRTNDPSQEFDAGFDVSYGSYETTGGVTEVNGFVSGGLSDAVAGRVAFIYKDRDGYYNNFEEGPDGADQEHMGIQGKLTFDVSDSTAIGLKVAYMDFEENGSDTAEVLQLGGPPRQFWEGLWVASGAQNADLFTAERDWNVWYNCGDALSVPAWGSVPIGSFCPGREQDSTNITFDVDHEVGPGSIKFIAAYQDYDYVMRFHALDGGLGNLFRAVRAEEFDSFSTELRFTSNEGEKFDYIAGIYYEDSDISRRQDSDLNLPPPFPTAQFQRQHEPWNQQTETIAIFAQARWHFSDRFTGIFGGRWSDESKDFAFERFNTPYGTDDGPVTPDITLREESRSESEFTPSVTLQFDVNDDINIFASFSQGHKTGGFGDRVDSQTSDLQYDAEFIDAIEVGIKSSWLDGAMTFNLVYYDMDIEGLQLATQAPGDIADFAVSNAADSTSKGFEAELNWSVNENWLLGINYAYTDATYDEFIGSPGCAPQFVNADGDCDLSGETLQFAPENKAAAFIDFFADGAISGWGIGARVDVSYVDDQYTDVTLADWALSEAYNMIGASVRLVSPDENISLALIGRNLGNEKINAWSASAGPNTISSMAPPRLLTLKLGVRF